jgi:RHS repeat-associated protein
MLKSTSYIVTSFIVLFFVWVNHGYAQSNADLGVQPYSSWHKEALIDQVNLRNLNVRLKIPIFRRLGRGMDFDYFLSYDSQIWWVPCNGCTGMTWAPFWNNKTWGWSAITATTLGFVGYTRRTDASGCTFSYNFVYVDPDGGNHPMNTGGLPEGVAWPASCANSLYVSTQAAMDAMAGNGIPDGSGYSMVVTANPFTVIVREPSGKTIVPPAFAIPPVSGQFPPPPPPPYSFLPSGPGTITDSNGNVISTDGTNFYDTLSSTVPALTVSGTNPVNYTYNGPQGPVSVKLNYSSYTVATNFGCTSQWQGGSNAIKEWGPTQEMLVSNITYPDGTAYAFHYEATPGMPGAVTGRIIQIDLPTGGSIKYVLNMQYTVEPNTSISNNGINCVVGQNMLATRTTPDGVWTYTQAPGPAGQQPAFTTTITDPAGNHTVHSFSNETLGYFAEYKVEAYQGAVTGYPLRAVLTCYNVHPAPCSLPGSFTPGAAAITELEALNGIQVKQRVTYLDYSSTSFSNVLAASSLPIEIDEYDWGNLQTPIVKKLMSYATLGNNIVDRPATVTITDGAGLVKSQTTYQYDQGSPQGTSGTPQLTAIVGSRGNPTTVSRLVQGSTTVSQLFTYFDTGQLNTVTDQNGQTTTYTFGDCGHTFLTKVSLPPLPLVLTRSQHWDCNGAAPLTMVDENQQQTTYSYDTRWRIAGVTYPDGGQSTITYNLTSTPPNVVESKTVNNSGISIMEQTNFDSFGRAVRSILQSDPDGAVYTDTAYDPLGRVYCVSNPYRSTSDSTYGITTHMYDAVGRVTRLQPPDYWANTPASSPTCLTVSPQTTPANPTAYLATSYYGNASTTTDEAGKSRETITDGLGRVTQVYEDPSGVNYETDYTYDALNNLLTVNQKGGTTNTTLWRTRTFAYDSLSRLTSATNPESGTISYSHDPNGNLTSKISPASNQTGPATVTVSYCYDALNRPTSKGYTFSPNTPPTCSNGALPSPVATYFYDQTTGVNGLSITNGLGRPTGMTDADTSESWSYDPLGRLLADQRGYGSSATTVSYTYWLDGSIATLGGLSYSTGGAGRPISLVDSSNDAYATNVHYSSAGDIAMIQNGPNIVTTRVYNSRLQPCWIYVTTGTPLPWNSAQCASTAAPASILDLKFNFGLGSNDNGNVLGVTNNRDNTRSQNFAYDQLNRLATAQTETSGVTIPNSNCWGFTFGYDSWGNLLSSSTTGPSGCGEPLPLNVTVNSNNQISGYCYDSAGNLLDPGPCNTPHMYTYDAENNLSSAGTTNYVYDGDGRRVWKWTYVTECVQNAHGTNPPRGTCRIGYHPVTVKQYVPNYVYGGNSAPLSEVTPGHCQGLVCFSSTAINYTFFAGHRIAKSYSLTYGFGPDFYFGDHLGSARVVTDVSGNLLDDADFYPFGGERNAINPTSGNHYKFTGYERDIESGLDYASARHFSGTMGRFMSPDPFYFQMTMLIDPQRFNLYAYARNNPLKWVDPSGQNLYLAGSMDWLSGLLYEMAGGEGAFNDYFHIDANGQVLLNEGVGREDMDNAGQGLIYDLVTSKDNYLYFAGTSGADAARLFQGTTKNGKLNGRGKDVSNEFTCGGGQTNSCGTVVGTLGRPSSLQPANLANGEPVFAVIAYNTGTVQIENKIDYGTTGYVNPDVIAAEAEGLHQVVRPVSLFIHESEENLAFRMQLSDFSRTFNYPGAHLFAIDMEAIIRRELKISGGFAGAEVKTSVPH